jgi:hypothetical protein
MKATFFMTYVMVDGWAGIANEILRVKALVIYHLKNMFIVKTERDRERAMDPGSIGLGENLPSLQLYFLLGLVYAVVTPLLLPFIIVFFAFAFLVYRHQVSWLIWLMILPPCDDPRVEFHRAPCFFLFGWLLASDHQRVQSGVRECCCVLASGALPDNS